MVANYNCLNLEMLEVTLNSGMYIIHMIFILKSLLIKGATDDGYVEEYCNIIIEHLTNVTQENNLPETL